MSEREKGFDWKLDGAGLAAFGTGAFLSVLALLALTRETPIEDPLAAGGTTTLAALWTSTLGAIPCLLLGAVMTVLGARTFLLGEARGTLKGVAIGAGVAFGLAIVLGSLGLASAWADGGIAGEALGGTLARRAHPLAGVLLGLVVLAAVVWFATLRERVLAREAHAAAAAPLRHAPIKAPLAAPTTAEANEGVTAEEAAALVPDDGHRREALAAALALAREHGDLHANDEPPPPFPYPEDVRLKGEIPAGTRPLGEPQRSYSAREPVQASSVVRWTPDRGDDADVFAEEASATALAEPEEEAEQAFDQPVHAWDARDTDEPLALEPLALEALALEPHATEPLATELELDVEDTRPAQRDAEPSEAVAAIVPAFPPRPSWEQNSLFREEDEPVDAYGTPISLVETLTGDEQLENAAQPQRDEAALLDEDAADGAQAEDELDGDELHEADSELDELDGDEEDEEEDEEDDEEEDDEEEDEEDEDEEEDEEDEEEFDEEFDEADELDEGSEDEDLDEAAALEDEALADGDGGVLIPQPTPVSEHKKRAALPDGSKQRIYEAGCLFLDRGRVAVSMLQREYGLEFDDACTMLDELQDMGLIGPYLGGKHRDILLTSDEWLERVSAS